MTVWYHLTTIFGWCLKAPRRKIFLPIAGLAVLAVAFITTQYFALPAFAAPNVTKTIGFQGRLLNAAGVPVPNGSYNIQFKLYEGGTGDSKNNTNGQLKWTETYINDGNPNGGVPVENGYFSVDLGSKTPFGNLVDWDTDTIWLSLNVAGKSVTCSDFGDTETDCEDDGEMLPMKRITATPYAINAGAVNGKTANDLIQLGQGVQNDTTDLSSLFINKLGNGNLIQLQNASTDVFTVDKNGDIELGSGNHVVNIQGSDDDTIGGSLGLSAGNGGNGDGADGGVLTLQGGDAGGLLGNGGNVVISGGKGAGDGADGLVIINTPTYQTADEQTCDEDCAVTQASIDNNGAILLGADQPNLTFTFNDPKNKTAGRVIYVTATGTSDKFTLEINGGVGAQNNITMRPNMTATLFWNGSDWTTSSLSAGGELPIQSSEHQNIQIGNGEADTNTTLLTLDKNGSAPLITDDSLLGSMYYDTELGKVQCYEAEGWGDCGSAPDTFVSLNPEYTNAVKQGKGTGEFSSDICSTDLGLNDGSDDQPEVCSDNETYNFYHWTSDETTTQTRSVYVTYDLPGTFKEFVDGSTSLLARTDSSDATVNYQFYKKTESGLVACGEQTIASTGSQTSWLKSTPENEDGADPADCEFEAGDSVVIRVSFLSKNDANAYASTLKFAFSNK